MKHDYVQEDSVEGGGGLAGLMVLKRIQYVLLKYHPYLHVCLHLTELLAALRPVCKLSLIRRCTGHGGVWILHLFRGYKEGRSEEGSYHLRKLPHVGRDQATQSTWVWGSKRAARRCCKPHGTWNTFSGFNALKIDTN